MKRKGILIALAVTLCHVLNAQNGLGGVGSTDGTSDLSLWLKVDEGLDYDGPTSYVELWGDQSGNLNTVSQDISSRMPEEIASSLNGYSVLRFDKSNNNFLTSSSFAVTQQDDVSMYMVFSLEDTLKNRAVFASRNSDGIIGMQLSPDSSNNFIYKGNGGNSENLGKAAAYSNHQIFFISRNADDTLNAYCNGSSILHEEDVHTNMGKGFEVYKFGTNFTQSLHTNMELAEAAIFFEENSDAERIIVQNYLSSKYAIDLDFDDYYDGDTGGKGDFDFDLIGIGAESGSSHDYSESPTGLGLRAKSGFADGDFVFSGHDNTTNDLNVTDLSGVAGLEGRWEKIWYADVTSSGAAELVDVSFDFSEASIALMPGDAANYMLLTRSGTTGAWNSLGTADSIGGDRVYFTDVDLGGDVYLTLGSSNLGLSPLPVELVAFEASAEDFSVRLRWETATETNSSHFDIERTTDGVEWEVLGTVEAAGTTTQSQFYQFVDHSPARIGYYRLRQVDLDGATDYSHLLVVEVPWISELQFYPNPATDKLFAGRPGEEANISISISGVNGSLIRQTVSDSKEAIDLSGLGPGTYFITLTEGLEEKTGKLLIQR